MCVGAAGPLGQGSGQENINIKIASTFPINSELQFSTLRKFAEFESQCR